MKEMGESYNSECSNTFPESIDKGKVTVSLLGLHSPYIGRHQSRLGGSAAVWLRSLLQTWLVEIASMGRACR
jgi:hypothetical protein